MLFLRRTRHLDLLMPSLALMVCRSVAQIADGLAHPVVHVACDRSHRRVGAGHPDRAGTAGLRIAAIPFDPGVLISPKKHRFMTVKTGVAEAARAVFQGPCGVRVGLH